MSARDLFFGLAFARGAHDVAAGDAGAVRLQDASSALPLFIARDLARHADVLDRRHVDDDTGPAARCAK